MDNYSFAIAAHYSSLLPMAISLVRFKRLQERFVPFLLFIWLGVANDFLSQYWIHTRHSNMVNSNIYVLAEFFLLLRTFAGWQKKKVSRYLLLASAGTIVWITDNLLIHRISDNNSLFRVFYAVLIVLLSIDELNTQVVYEKKQLFRNAVFLICFTFMIYYGNKAYIESFNLYHLPISNAFYDRLWMIMNLINTAASLTYTYAILCIRPKTSLQLPY